VIQAVKAGVPPPSMVPLTGQERAWTSPLWYTPSAEARKNAPADLIVADLKAKGATQLGDVQLKALIVRKAFSVRSNVTGDQVNQDFTSEGNTTIFHVDRYTNVPRGYGTVPRDGYRGTTIPYKIENGKLIMLRPQGPYSFTVYNLGDTYYGARSNEFGYANYEMIPSPQCVLNPLTAMLNQFSIELGPHRTAEATNRPHPEGRGPQLQELKNNTSLKPLEKVEQLKQISGSIVDKINPILNPPHSRNSRSFAEMCDGG
jgi:hypothetical protein